MWKIYSWKHCLKIFFQVKIKQCNHPNTSPPFDIIKKEYDNYQFKNLEKVIGIHFASMKFLSSKASPQNSKGI